MATEPEPPRLSPRPRTPDGWGREMTAALERGKRANRSRAVALYREAAALAPWDAESPVRLALLLLEDGHLLEAEAALATAAPLDKPLTLRYMEALARARLAERRGRLDDAASAYERAAAMMPLAQTPLLAAARLLFVRGRSAEARALLARLTSTAGAGDDPRWQFVLGQTWRRGEYLQQLDGMVRRCGR